MLTVSVVNLNDCFPEGADGSRKPLVKQIEFLKAALDTTQASPKFIAYVGGIGSGKTIIGCITMLAMGVQSAGDYLICRLYSPELKITTYKTFLEICPPELVIEHRIADMHIRVKAANGISNFYFRPLEDPEKFRSMNLNAALIDECNQVSEEAFLLLQGRLRGKAWRKILVVSNPAGHDWVYRNFFKKDHLKNDWAKAQYKLIRAPSTENYHLPEGYLETLQQSWSEDRIAREIEGSFDAFEGAVYNEFRRDTHVIKPFKIPDHWPRYIGIDHGYRNPAAWVWVAIGPDGEAYAYREYYESERLIHEIVQGHTLNNEFRLGTLNMMNIGKDNPEKITYAFIDPSTKARRGTNGQSDWDEYARVLPKDFPLYPAKNDVQVGIDRVKSYFKIHPRTNKPNLYIFDTCINLIEEITQYRYQELRPNQEDRRAEHEKPVKNNDHALDALRYVIVTLPDPADKAVDAVGPKYNSLEFRLQKELTKLNNPKKSSDPWGTSI